MDIKQLMYFVMVAEELRFNKAADRLHMAQPIHCYNHERIKLGFQRLSPMEDRVFAERTLAQGK